MKTNVLLATAFVAFALTATSFYSCSERTMANKIEKADETPLDGMRGWSDASKVAVMQMMNKYGQPDEMTSEMMLWNNTGQWKRTVVYAKEFKHDFPLPHTDVMQQWIDYRVPAEKFTDLAHYDGSVVSNRTNGEISARCDLEGANYLAINLAHDIIRGNKDVQAAREFYATCVKAMINGDKPDYMQKLQFDVPNGNTAHTDNPSSIISQEDMAKMKKMKEKMKKEMMDMAARNNTNSW